MQVVARHRIQHEWFERLANKVMSAEPPCMSNAEDWESAGGWATEIDMLSQTGPAVAPTPAIDPGESESLFSWILFPQFCSSAKCNKGRRCVDVATGQSAHS